MVIYKCTYNVYLELMCGWCLLILLCCAWISIFLRPNQFRSQLLTVAVMCLTTQYYVLNRIVVHMKIFSEWGIYKPCTPIDKEVWCMNLQFHLEAFEYMMILSFMWTKKLTMCLPLPPFFSPFLNDNTRKKKKQQKQVTKGFLKENKFM